MFLESYPICIIAAWNIHISCSATSRSHEHLSPPHSKLLVAVFVNLYHHNRNTFTKKGTKMVCGTRRVHITWGSSASSVLAPGCCDNQICFSFHIITCYCSIIMKFNSHCQITLFGSHSPNKHLFTSCLIKDNDKERIIFCTQQTNAPLFHINITSLHISHCLGFKLMMCYLPANLHPTTTQLKTHNFHILLISALFKLY
jgi:hypothetical protein